MDNYKESEYERVRRTIAQAENEARAILSCEPSEGISEAEAASGSSLNEGEVKAGAASEDSMREGDVKAEAASGDSMSEGEVKAGAASESFMSDGDLGGDSATRETERAWRRFQWKRNRRKIIWISSAAAAVLIAVITIVPALQRSEKAAPALATEILPAKGNVTLRRSNGQVIALDKIGQAEEGDNAARKVKHELAEGITIDADAGSIDYQTAGSERYAAEESAGTGSGNMGSQLDELSTAKGRAYSVTLSDGTKVYLNSETTLKYPAKFAGSERIVMLDGEAYFEVAPDAKRPFIVRTGRYDVKVLGTKFDVSAYGDEAVSSTTLVSGKVSILDGESTGLGKAGGAATGNANASRKAGEEELVPGQQYRRDAETGIASIAEVDTDEYTSWINDQLTMRRMSLKEIFGRLERRYDFTYSLSPDAADELFSGSIPLNENLSIVLDQLCGVSGLKYKIEGNKVTIE